MLTLLQELKYCTKERVIDACCTWLPATDRVPGDFLIRPSGVAGASLLDLYRLDNLQCKYALTIAEACDEDTRLKMLRERKE